MSLPVARLAGACAPGSERQIARTPSHLTSNAHAVLVARQRAGAREHRRERVGHRLGGRVGRRVHAVDHPVLRARRPCRAGTARSGRCSALAVQLDLDLARLPLELARRCRVSQIVIVPRAVLALGDLAVELEVLERVVLGAHRQAVVLRRRRAGRSGRPRTPARRRARGAGPSAAAWRECSWMTKRRAGGRQRPRPRPPSAPGCGPSCASRGRSRACRSRRDRQLRADRDVAAQPAHVGIARAQAAVRGTRADAARGVRAVDRQAPVDRARRAPSAGGR